MTDILSEAKVAGLQEPEKPVEEMTEEELKTFRTSFDPDSMGFYGTEGIDEKEDDENGSNETED